MRKTFNLLLKWQERYSSLTRGTAILLIGISGSGKSTIASEFSRIGWTVISSDAIREEFSPAKDELDQSYNPIGEIKRRIVIAAKKREKIMVDATHSDKNRRQEMVEFLHNQNYLVLGVWLDTPLNICLSRNLARDKPRPVWVLCNMHSFLWGGPIVNEVGKEIDHIRVLSLPSILKDGFDGLWRVDIEDWG